MKWVLFFSIKTVPNFCYDSFLRYLDRLSIRHQTQGHQVNFDFLEVLKISPRLGFVSKIKTFFYVILWIFIEIAMFLQFLIIFQAKI